MSAFLSAVDDVSGGAAPPRGAARPLPIEAFACLVEAELGLPRGSAVPEARLIEDLGLDSLQMLDLLLLLDALDAHIEPEAIARVTRMRDLHRLFVDRWTLAQHAGLVCESTPPGWIPETTRGRMRGVGSQRLTGLRSRLRALRASDEEFLYDLVQQSPGASLARHGKGPNPRSFSADLWRGVLDQRLILDRTSDGPIGLVAARNADARRGVAWLEVTLHPRVQGRGWPFESVMLFVDHLFRGWPLRKLYAEVLAGHLDDVASGVGRLFVEEGRLAAHEYVDGGWSDLHILALFRERWERDAPRVLRGLVPGRAAGERGDRSEDDPPEATDERD